MVEAAAAAPVAEILAAGTVVAETPAHLAMAEPQAVEILAATQAAGTAEPLERPAMVGARAVEMMAAVTTAVVAEEARAAEVERAVTVVQWRWWS